MKNISLCTATGKRESSTNRGSIEKIDAERMALHQRLDAEGWPWDPQLSYRLDRVDGALEEMEGGGR